MRELQVLATPRDHALALGRCQPLELTLRDNRCLRQQRDTIEDGLARRQSVQAFGELSQ